MKPKVVGATILAALCASVMAFVLAGCAGTAAGTTNAGITVSASSEMKVVPDKARISVSVVTEGKTAEDCQDENAKSVNAVIEALGKLEVADESIQTINTWLSPRYGSSSDKDDDYKITGYEMTTTLRVSDLDIANVGATMQSCISAGANEVYGMEYYASNYDEAYQQALEDALEVAHGKAQGLADAAGVSLGTVVDVSEGYQDTSARYVEEMADMDTAMGSAGNTESAAKTMPGQTTIRAELTVTYAIR